MGACEDACMEEPPTSDEEPGPARRVVAHCPWCGEHVGSFWGRREADGSHWCESCQAFFEVRER
jgi:hypothetical protein